LSGLKSGMVILLGVDYNAVTSQSNRRLPSRNYSGTSFCTLFRRDKSLPQVVEVGHLHLRQVQV